MSNFRFIKSIVAGAIAALSIAATGIAQADVVTANANLNSPTHAFFNLTDPANMGPFKITPLDITVAGNPNTQLNGSYFGFCIEPDQLTSADATLDEEVPGTGTGDSSYVTNFITVSKEVQRLFDMEYTASKASGQAATAFNLVLQELLLEQSGSYSLNDGSYVREGAGDFDMAAADAGSAMLAAVLAGSDAATHFRIVTSVSSTSQDLMMALAPEAPTDVPEPGSVALLLAGLGAMGAVRRRRNRG